MIFIWEDGQQLEKVFDYGGLKGINIKSVKPEKVMIHLHEISEFLKDEYRYHFFRQINDIRHVLKGSSFDNIHIIAGYDKERNR